MPARREEQLLIDAARMYYLEGLDQKVVGDRLGLSRSSVSRVLTAARRAGIVQVRIKGVDQVTRCPWLEDEIAKRFSLSDIYVANTHNRFSEMEAVAEIGAQIFADRAPHVQQIGFSWGRTIGALIEAIDDVKLHRDIVFAPLVGGMPTVDGGLSGNSYIQRVAGQFGARAIRFDAPAIVESEATWKALIHESSVTTTIEKLSETQLAFVGIGSYGVQTSAKLVEAMHFSPSERQMIAQMNPVGDMCSVFYDRDGQICGPPLSRRVIGIGLERLAAIDTVIGLAAGADKVHGLIGALKTGCLTVLVIDDILAQDLLDEGGKHE